MRQSAPGLKATPLLSRIGIAVGLALATFQLPAQKTVQVKDPLATSVTIDADRQPLEKVLKRIASNTQVKFAYDVDEIRKYTVTLREKKEFSLEEVLKKLLEQTNLVFESHSNTVVIYDKGEMKQEPAASSINSLVSFASARMVRETISGTVTDENGPVQAASVRIKGSTNGTQTDEKGNFKLETEESTVTLVVSSVGYASREIVAHPGAPLTIRLEKADLQLDKVVVVGYGTQKRITVSGAIADVKLDKVTSRSMSNVTEALQGKTPGVMVTAEGGDPTAAPTVNIRGMGGINGESPLYVVDGSIYSGTPTINPNEVESISVLKDAAAAIYGARASGGVILITTKKGKSGAASINLDAKYGWQTPWRKLHALNAKQYADVMNTAADNAGVNRLDAFNASVYPDGQITKTNWIDDIFQTGPIQDYNAGITGGSDKSKYYMSFGYRKADGILLNTYTERYNFRINSEHQLKPWLKFGENMQFTYSNGNGANTSSAYTGALLSAIFYPPSVAPYTADGSYSGLPVDYAGSYGDVINPVAYLKRLDAKYPSNVLFANPYLEVKLLHDLSFRSNLAITKAFSSSKVFTSKVPEIGKIFDYNQLSQSSSNYTDLLAEQTFNYSTHFGDHHLSAVAGYSYQHTRTDAFSVYAQGFNDESVIYRYFDNSTDIYKPSSGMSQTAVISYYGRVNYDFQEKYLITALARRDGTSLVAGANRWANYGSVSAGWVVSKEEFMKNIDWISNLKLRASYGVLGNLGSLPANSVDVPLGSTSAYLGQDPTLVYGYAENQLSNHNLKWAHSNQRNIGLDLGLFHNRVSLVADAFVKKTLNMLMQVSTPSTSGVSNGIWENVGEARDKGVELGIFYNSAPKAAFQYSVGATLTSLSNKLVSLGDGVTTIPTSGYNIRSTLTPLLVQVGSPLYSYNVVQTAGIFKTQEEIDNYKSKDGTVIQPNAKPGDLKFIDASGDGTISDADRVVKGSAYPNITYGLSFNASYKNFDLNLFFQGVQGNKIFNGLRYLSLQAGVSGQNYNMLDGVLDAWSTTNPNGKVPRVSLSDPNGNFSTTSDFFIQSGSYTRLKNITLGYTVPGNLVQRFGMNSLRLYASANNLLTFTNYGGFDPEVGMGGKGIDIAGYPQARSILIGLNVNF